MSVSVPIENQFGAWSPQFKQSQTARRHHSSLDVPEEVKN
jgi:hypothetical protein